MNRKNKSDSLFVITLAANKKKKIGCQEMYGAEIYNNKVFYI